MLVQPKLTRSILSILVYFIIVLNQCSTTHAVDYCNIPTCKPKGPHPMCLYPTPTPAAACIKYVPAHIGSSDRARILNWHNELRAKVANGLETRGSNGGQPPASNMRTLKWDNELAKIAQRSADQCVNEHDKCMDVKRFQVGQNIATAHFRGTMTSVEEVMNVWYKEVDLFDNNDVNKYVFSEDTGHYTQLVWAKTSLVGCGRVRYTDPPDATYETVRIFCNYGEAGNVDTLPIYEIGTAASDCSSVGVSQTVPGLCN